MTSVRKRLGWVVKHGPRTEDWWHVKREVITDAIDEIDRLTAALQSVQTAMNTQNNGGVEGWMMDVERALGGP